MSVGDGEPPDGSDGLASRRNGERHDDVGGGQVDVLPGRAQRHGQHRDIARRRRRGLLFMAALVVVALVAASVAVFASGGGPKTPSTSVTAGRHVTVTVPPGAPTVAIASLLQHAGVINDASSFVNAAVSGGQAAELKPGTYHLVTGMRDGDVLGILVTGPGLGRTVTIPEGFTVAQVAARLEQLGYSPSAVNAALASPTLRAPYRPAGKPLEGLLFPATYPIGGQSPLDVIRAMFDQTATELGSLDLGPAHARGLTPYQVLIVASLIEREAKLPADRAKVAAVIYNRLKANMPLQMNATIDYALGRHINTRLPAADTKINSPYNSYLHTGLPPTPIANPGLASIAAAVNPAPGKWLYYVVTSKDGAETFTSSYPQFQRLLAKAQEEGLD